MLRADDAIQSRPIGIDKWDSRYPRYVSDLDCDSLDDRKTAMILTCPNCATRFFAAASVIGPIGRRVECNACGTVWLATLNPHRRPVWEVDARSATGDITVENTFGEIDPPRIQSPLFVDREAVARRRTKKRSRGGAYLTLILLLLIVTIIAGLLILQRPIERIFPGSIPIYQSVGLPQTGAGGG